MKLKEITRPNALLEKQKNKTAQFDTNRMLHHFQKQKFIQKAIHKVTKRNTGIVENGNGRKHFD